MRLIDADELKESLKNLEAKGYNRKYVQGLQDAIDGYFPQIIDDAPTADVQPVKHGKWEICSDGYYPYCSNCKNEPQGREMTLFCPNCGARMDGDVNEI